MKLIQLYSLISFCTELGPGWSPAFLETQREIDFIRASEERASEFGSDGIQHYYIAGSVNLDIRPRSYPTCTFNVTKSGNSSPFLYS